MAKRKQGPTIEIAQHTSASEAVKVRRRTWRKPTTTTALPTPIHKVEEKENVPIVLRPLPLANLDELFKIWDADKRIPTVESRRAWAAARNVAPQDVHRFFSRQKALTKKARKGLPKGTYTLLVGTPPVIKQEEEASCSKPRRQVVRSNVKAERLETPLNLDAPTSDTLVASPQQKQKSGFQMAGNSSPLPPSSPPAPACPAPDLQMSPILLLSPCLPNRPHITDNDSEDNWCLQARVSSPETSVTCALCTPGFTICTYCMLKLTLV